MCCRTALSSSLRLPLLSVQPTRPTPTTSVDPTCWLRSVAAPTTPLTDVVAWPTGVMEGRRVRVDVAVTPLVMDRDLERAVVDVADVADSEVEGVA
jgi:hypothetical protein